MYLEMPHLECCIFGFLRYLNECPALVFQLFDELTPFADDHTGRGVGNKQLDLLLSFSSYLKQKKKVNLFFTATL